MKFIISLISILTCVLHKSQNLPKDSIYGNIKRIREKVVFLTAKENHQLLYYDDYGHSGFMGPESTIARFFDSWFSFEGSYYINYERYYDKKRRITKDIWFGKKDNFLDSYRYVYDDKDRLISKIDSSKYSYGTKNHYYTNYGDENVISENSKFDFFSHTYKKYKDGKLILSKNFDEGGTVDEYKYYYNSNGKLSYRIYKNPNSWQKVDERSWSYGVQDSIGAVYKDIINEYDKSGRISQILNYDLYEDEKYQTPVVTKQIKYIYKDQNLITRIQQYKDGKPTYYNYKYDKTNKLIEKLCCSETISDAKLIQKYFYKDNRIDMAEYIEEDFETKKMKKYKISFSYKYDKNNNWIEIIKNVDGRDLYKWIREIEYYDNKDIVQ